jgi:SAM-dependent methyltransferase
MNISGYDPFIKEYSHQSTLETIYQAVVSYDVIEHFDDVSDFFEITSTLVKPGGLLIVGTPNASGIRLDQPEEDAWLLHQPYHRHILSEQKMREIGLKYNFSTEHVLHRYYTDTYLPFLNTRFMKEYSFKAGNVLDIAIEAPQPKLLFSSPKLWFYAFFGYLFPPKGLMTVCFRKN